MIIFSRKTMVILSSFICIGLISIPGMNCYENDYCFRLDQSDETYILSFDDQLDQFQNQTDGYGWAVLEGNMFAQCFIPDLNVITRVELLIKQNEYFENGKLTVSIRDSLTGEDLTNITINSSDFPFGAPTYVEFDFPDINVVPGNNYYIIWYPYVSYLDWLITWRAGDNNPYPKGEAYFFDLRIPDWISFKFHDIGHPDPDFVFLTYGYNNHAPNEPEINGISNGKARTTYEYIFSASDIDEDKIYYFIDWGDDSIERWIGPYSSNEEVILNHTWSNQGTYTIKAKCKDIFNAESEWVALEISMPKNKTFNFPFLRFLENHPHLFPLLRHLLGL